MPVSVANRLLSTARYNPDFNPETGITWHSLFWAEGSDFAALGLADTDAVTTWPNETGESDATAPGTTPTYVAALAGLSGQPAVSFPASGGLQSAAFTSTPTAPMTVVAVTYWDTTISGYILDGRSINPRNTIQSGGDGLRIYAGSALPTSTGAAGGHLYVATFDGSTGADTLDVDGVEVISSDAGSHIINGITIGNRYSNDQASTVRIAFLGIYEGDITADPNYGAFLLWANEHYGLQVSPFMSGGTISQPGDGYVYHTFTTSGTLTPIGDPVEVEYLVVAGGGGGAGPGSDGGGGGGAGGLLSGTATVAAAQTVTIGGGGAALTQGSSTSLGGVSAVGGGAGGTAGGGSGGSGGGAGSGGGVGGAGTAGQGYDGGASAYRAGGGGGGASAIGASAVSNIGADGADGVEWPASSGTFYAGGGGGGVRFTGIRGGAGGAGGGGAGVVGGNTGGVGAANTGGGGGGTSSGTGGAGGSGIVIARYPVDYTSPGWPIPTTGLYAWFDADDEITVVRDTNGKVSQWSDKSRNGRHLVQATSGQRPGWSQSWDTRHALDMTTNSSWMYNSSMGTPSQPVSVFIVYEVDTYPASSFAGVWTWASDGSGLTVRSTNEWTAGIGSWVAVGGTRPGLYARTMFTIMADGASSEYWANGIQLTGGGTSTLAPNGTTFQLNERYNGVGNCQFGGRIAELVIYTGTPDREAIEAYLNDKWAVY